MTRIKRQKRIKYFFFLNKLNLELSDVCKNSAFDGSFIALVWPGSLAQLAAHLTADSRVKVSNLYLYFVKTDDEIFSVTILPLPLILR